LEALSAHQAATFSCKQLQTDLDQLAAQIQQLVQKHPSLRKEYEAAIQMQLRTNLNPI
jgi:outer membrane murein-binding lipoprotein Lpp